MLICVTSAAIKKARINVGTTCVKYVVTKTPNVANVPNISSIANKTNATAMNLQGARFFLFEESMKKCAAINPTITDNIAAESCAMPYSQSYVVKITLTSFYNTLHFAYIKFSARVMYETVVF